MPRPQHPLRPCSLAHLLQRPVVPLFSVHSSLLFLALGASEEAFPSLQFQVWVQTTLPAYSTPGRGDIPSLSHNCLPRLPFALAAGLPLDDPGPASPLWGAPCPSPTFHSLPQEPPGSHCLLEHSPRARVITWRLL